MLYEVLGKNDKVLGKTKKTDQETLKGFLDMIQDGTLSNEFLEVLYRDGKATGRIKPRDLVHEDGDYHASIQWHEGKIFGGEAYNVWQLRAPNKDVCPGMLDAVVAGHFAIGEDMEDAKREVSEEIGINPYRQKPFYMGKRTNMDYQPTLINREVQDVFINFDDYGLDDYLLEDKELSGIYLVRCEDLIDVFMGRKAIMSDVEAVIFNPLGKLEKKQVYLGKKDFCHSLDNYYLKTAVFTKMLAEGYDLPANPYSVEVTSFLS